MKEEKRRGERKWRVIFQNCGDKPIILNGCAAESQ